MARHVIEVDDNKSVFDQGLAVMLHSYRADRPNEWQMDEFADLARDLELRIKDLEELSNDE